MQKEWEGLTGAGDPQDPQDHTGSLRYQSTEQPLAALLFLCQGSVLWGPLPTPVHPSKQLDWASVKIHSVDEFKTKFVKKRAKLHEAQLKEHKHKRWQFSSNFFTTIL